LYSSFRHYEFHFSFSILVLDRQFQAHLAPLLYLS